MVLASAVDLELEEPLRPRDLSQFIGQEKHRDRLSIACQAARERHEPLDHLLLSGPSGLGKTTLANIAATEMGGRLVTTSGPALTHLSDLMGLLTKLGEGDVFFIDEIHSLDPMIAEYIYPAMEDFIVDYVFGEGEDAESVRMPIQPFTLIGATTRKGRMPKPMRERFGFTFNLTYYDLLEMTAIVERSARVLEVLIDSNAALEIARRSRGTPRIANRLLRRVRDYAQVRRENPIIVDVVEEALVLEGVDELGLDALDRQYLLTLMVQYEGRPTGAAAMAATMQEDLQTLVDTVEPFLLHEGLIVRTPRGRCPAPSAYQHLLGRIAA